MSVRRRLALGGGVAAAAVGLALAVQPSLLGGAGPDEWAVNVLGAVALLYAGILVYARRTGELETAAVPDPETPTTPPSAGDEMDALLAAAASTRLRATDRRHRLRRRLEQATTAALCRREDCDTETAREMLAEGAWTDDPVAASYFTDGPLEVADVPLSARFRLRLSTPSRRAYAVRRVADEMAALTDPGDRR